MQYARVVVYIEVFLVSTYPNVPNLEFQSYDTGLVITLLKGVVAQGYANFQKLVRMAIRHVPRFRILNLGTCIITIDNILQKFAYPWATRFADFIGFSGEPHLK